MKHTTASFMFVAVEITDLQETITHARFRNKVMHGHAWLGFISDAKNSTQVSLCTQKLVMLKVSSRMHDLQVNTCTVTFDWVWSLHASGISCITEPTPVTPQTAYRCLLCVQEDHWSIKSHHGRLSFAGQEHGGHAWLVLCLGKTSTSIMVPGYESYYKLYKCSP